MEEKRSRCDTNIHKAMRIPVDIYQGTKNLFVTVQPKNACKFESADHLWLPFIDQPQSDIIVSAIVSFHVYNVIVTKCKHGIVHNDIITFNKGLKFISTSIL